MLDACLNKRPGVYLDVIWTLQTSREAAMHAIGIPIIIAGSLLACFTHWRIGLALFLAGWILLFAGHRIEGNKPAFFQGVIYFLVGPLWIAKELKDALFGASHRSTPTH
jgi:uncharacterized membrane protein YGL010W